MSDAQNKKDGSEQKDRVVSATTNGQKDDSKEKQFVDNTGQSARSMSTSLPQGSATNRDDQSPEEKRES